MIEIETDRNVKEIKVISHNNQGEGQDIDIRGINVVLVNLPLNIKVYHY